MNTKLAPSNKVAEMPKKSLITLPTEKTKPKDKVSDYKWLIYGPAGIGKTTFANNFDTPLILDFEGRTKHLECYSVPIGSWDDVQDVYGALKNTDHQFKTVVFDTADIFYRLCVAHICQKRKIEHPSDEQWGKGSDMVKNAMYATIAAFQALNLCIVFTSHMQEKEIKTRSISYTKTTTSLSGSPASIFLPLVDIIGYCHFDEASQEKRLITFKGSDYVDAKKSTNEVVQLPDECELDFNVVKSFFKGEKGQLNEG